jgi:predicted RNase H-like nuclease (RuvC/YqgF family)
MTQDRTYFRMLSDTALAEAARYCDNDLALVLGERLRDLVDVDEQLERAQTTIEELQAEIAMLEAERVELEAQLDEILRPDK